MRQKDYGNNRKMTILKILWGNHNQLSRMCLKG